MLSLKPALHVCAQISRKPRLSKLLSASPRIPTHTQCGILGKPRRYLLYQGELNSTVVSNGSAREMTLSIQSCLKQELFFSQLESTYTPLHVPTAYL